MRYPGALLEQLGPWHYCNLGELSNIKGIIFELKRSHKKALTPFFSSAIVRYLMLTAMIHLTSEAGGYKTTKKRMKRGKTNLDGYNAVDRLT